MIELSEPQIRAMAEAKAPLHVLNPRTQEVFVLIRQDVYQLTCSIVGGKKGEVWGDDDDDLIQRELGRSRTSAGSLKWTGDPETLREIAEAPVSPGSDQ